MKAKLILSTFVLLFPFLMAGQDIVPPVRTENNGTMTITPNPNGQTRSSTSTTGTGNNQNSVTIIVDHSGSMQGAPIKAAKNSSVILIDLIDLWGKELFPQQIGNMQLQYIQFGGKGEFNELHKLGKITDMAALRRQIINSPVNYGNTDFATGFEPALRQLAGKNLNNKTIFLTDAGDNGLGADADPSKYKDLIDTKFIIYNSGNSSVERKKWLSAVPNGSEYQVGSEYEVLALFVKTLFEFVDDINYYLVRQGTQSLGQDNTFAVYKHSSDKRNMMILSKSAGTNLEIDKILDSSGKEVADTLYKVYATPTFFNIFLEDALASGEYKIVFKSSELIGSHNLFYINFEKCNIFLDLETTPVLQASECFLENSSVNFNFKYWDADQNKEITYPDFLSHSAFHYKITDSIIDQTGKGNSGLVFSHSFSVGSAGSYQVWSAWSYNEEKMKHQNNPPLSLQKDFCVSVNGSLVHLAYDTLMTWEGRKLEFVANILDNNPYILDNTKVLYLNTGTQTIPLHQDTTNKQHYRGTLDYVQGNHQYILSLNNKDNRFRFALDDGSLTTFWGKKRYIRVSYSGKDYTSLKSDNLSNMIKKIRYVISNNNIPIKKYSYEGKDIVIPYYLPYYDEIDDDIQFTFGINKIFPDEIATLQFRVDSTVYSYPYENALVGGLWGVFATKRTYPDAVTVGLQVKDTVLENSYQEINQMCTLTKREGQMYFPDPLYKEPSIQINGEIAIQTINGRIVTLDNTSVKLEISTNDMDRLYVRTKWTVYKFACLCLLVFLLIVYLVLWYVSYIKNAQKIRLWKRLKKNDLSPLEDLWNDPLYNRKCAEKLEIPVELKDAFLSPGGDPSKELFLEWLHSDLSEKKGEIKKRFCYRSLFYKNAACKIFYVLLFPLFVLIDLGRNAFELDSKVIKNKKMLEYVLAVENTNVSNIPSDWSFCGQPHIGITQLERGENNVRLRDNSHIGISVEILFYDNYLTIICKTSFVTLYLPNGKDRYLCKNQQEALPAGLTSCRVIMNDEIVLSIEDIDYETKSCVIRSTKN